MLGAITVRVFLASSRARVSISGVKPVEPITIAAPAFDGDFEMFHRGGGRREVQRDGVGPRERRIVVGDLDSELADAGELARIGADARCCRALRARRRFCAPDRATRARPADGPSGPPRQPRLD